MDDKEKEMLVSEVKLLLAYVERDKFNIETAASIANGIREMLMNNSPKFKEFESKMTKLFEQALIESSCDGDNNFGES